LADFLSNKGAFSQVDENISKLLSINTNANRIMYYIVKNNNGLRKKDNNAKVMILNYALDNHKPEIIVELINQKIYFNQCKSTDDLKKLILNKTALTSIIACLEANEIDLNKQDDEGKTILHYAYEFASPEVIKALIEYGASENIEDDYEAVPCFYAYYNKNKNVTGCKDKNNP
jgi:ankyrin repeat protein